MTDREFLMWIHARLTGVHGEHPHTDYMHRFRAVISSIPENQCTPNDGRSQNSLSELRGSLKTNISSGGKIPVITKCSGCSEYYHAGGGKNGRWCQLMHKQVDDNIWYRAIPKWCPLPDADW